MCCFIISGFFFFSTVGGQGNLRWSCFFFFVEWIQKHRALILYNYNWVVANIWLNNEFEGVLEIDGVTWCRIFFAGRIIFKYVRQITEFVLYCITIYGNRDTSPWCCWHWFLSMTNGHHLTGEIVDFTSSIAWPITWIGPPPRLLFERRGHCHIVEMIITHAGEKLLNIRQNIRKWSIESTS